VVKVAVLAMGPDGTKVTAPSVTPPVLKVTEPAGAASPPFDAVTVSVNVTGSPKTDDVGATPSVEVVGARTTVKICVSLEVEKSTLP
jgi:hypothetical protein